MRQCISFDQILPNLIFKSCFVKIDHAQCKLLAEAFQVWNIASSFQDSAVKLLSLVELW